MSEHYYSQTPSAGHERHIVRETLHGHTLTFVTDAGVFSKKQIDYGSRCLIEHLSLDSGDMVLDVGCGYGAIGLFAAKQVGEGVVTMIDVNERAVALAQENADKNNISNVRILQSDLFDRLGNDTFDVVVSNPPIRAGKSVVHSIYEGAAERLKVGGTLWVVIQKKQGAPSTLKKLKELFVEVVEVDKSKGYRIFKAMK